MKRDRPSLTAAGIAAARAIESEKPAGERICYDPYARLFLGRAFYAMTKFFVNIGYSEWRGPGTMGFIVARERFIDDFLKSWLDEELEPFTLAQPKSGQTNFVQLVILGAGYDSRSYRFEGIKDRVKVFEVDHPATQAAKVEKLIKVLVHLPKYVTFVSIDFNTQSLDQRLGKCGYDETLKSLFIWQGVTYYLQAEAVDSTLAFVAQHSAPGSVIIFDYIYTSLLDGTVRHGEVTRIQRYRRMTGEGLTFGIPEGEVEEFLQQRGFDQVKDTHSEELKEMYFKDVNQNRQVVSGYAIVSARVCRP
jgi:methyltransferase (TIGR00027 family)